MADQLGSSPIIEQVLGPATAKLTRFHAKLEKESEPRGLISPRDVDIIWERHILNSAALLPFVRTALDAIPSRLYLGEVDGENAPIVGDIGSGGGFPGIVLAALLPHVRFFLIEPMERRCEWLQEVVEELDLNNATIVRARTEELEAILKRKAGGKSGKTRGKGKNSLKSDRSASAKNIGKLNNAGTAPNIDAINNAVDAVNNANHIDKSENAKYTEDANQFHKMLSLHRNTSYFDAWELFQEENPYFSGFNIVTCRAVAPMTKLARMTLPLLVPGGRLIALKGKSAQAELDKAEKELRKNHADSYHVCLAPVGPGLEPTHVVTVSKK